MLEEAAPPKEPDPVSSVRPAAHGIAADTVVERPGEMCWCSKRTGGAWMRRHREACLPTNLQDETGTTETNAAPLPEPTTPWGQPARQLNLGQADGLQRRWAPRCRQSGACGLLIRATNASRMRCGHASRRQRSRHGKGLAGHAY